LKRRHFESLRPICPLCQFQSQREAPLAVSFAVREDDEAIQEGALRCTEPSCRFEFPIIDGIPVVVPDPATFLATNMFQVMARQDLSAELENMLGECAGPGSGVDAIRQQVGCYAWDHYGDLDPAAADTPGEQGSLLRALAAALELPPAGIDGPVLDAGCSVGRGTFALAGRVGGPVLGVDLHIPMLRLAAAVLRDGEIRYDLRRLGMLYERRRYAVELEAAEQVDFWACDATALPFPRGSFSAFVGMNVMDCVASPLDLLRSAARVLRSGGDLLLASPYDWSGGATSPGAWIGGHSPRSDGAGRSESVLRALLTPGAHAVSVAGLELAGELDDVPWRVRLHDRHTASYRLHVVHAKAVAVAD
jgi:SAM-dependent methyltransferase/uncharacterized protein YbaR (Trm112 family)